MRPPGEGGCCARCHFRWEERELFPLLRRLGFGTLADELGVEHLEILELRSATLRRKALARHAAREEMLLRIHGVKLPPALAAELARQHKEH